MHNRAECFGDGRVRNIRPNRPHRGNTEDQNQNRSKERASPHTGESYEKADQQSDDPKPVVHGAPHWVNENIISRHSPQFVTTEKFFSNSDSLFKPFKLVLKTGRRS